MIIQKKRTLAVAVALATAEPARANVIGSDTQHFNPTTSGLDFVTVQSSETLQPGVVNAGVFLNHAVNSLPYYDSGARATEQRRLRYSDAVTGADYNLGVGLLDGWDAGISLPQVILQKSDSDAFHGEFRNRGGTEVRVNSKLRLWGDGEQGVALVGTVNINRIRNNPHLGRGAGPTYNLELAADREIAGVAVGVNVGYRARNPGEPNPGFPVRPYGNQIIASAAASFLMTSLDTKLIAEVFGARPTARLGGDERRQQTSAEALVGVKLDWTSEVALHAGAGTELNHAFASPDWRAYAGVNWTFGPVFKRPPEPERVPPKVPPSPAEPSETVVARDLHFRSGSDQLEDQSVIESLAGVLGGLGTDPAFKRLEIEGHTDSVGSEAMNMDLSQRRAERVRKAVSERYGIPLDKIKATGFGETMPIADNGNYQGRRLNRRVVIKVFKQ